MKMVSKLVAIALLSCAVSGLAYAGVWGHSQTSAGTYSNYSVNIPMDAGYCNQYGIAPSPGSYIYNSGPHGDFSGVYNEGMKELVGPIPAGTYTVIQIVSVAGVSNTWIQW
jgi:hypothetical protein